ncbi:MAG: SurA N-terminal domain-containing protein [Lysobacteraceae bacterium]
MLQTLREKMSGWVAVVILAILVVPFAFVGIENYFTQQVATYVAKINDAPIEQDTFRRSFDEHRQQMRQMLGDRYDAAQFDTPETKRQVLDGLIDREVLKQAADKYGIVVTAEQLQKEIKAFGAFQLDGHFDPAQYRAVLLNAQMTPRMFEQRMYEDMLVRMLPEQIGDSGFITPSYVDRYLALRDQTRSFGYVVLPAPEDAAIGEITDEAVQAYYDSHSGDYTSPETVALEYLELDASKLEVSSNPDDAELRARYDEQKARFVEAEQRLASHILVSVSANADAKAQSAALEKAQKIATKAREAGVDFASMAQAESDDAGSKATGGDLGWIEKGITDPAFEEALFGMQPGVSEPVKSSEGWHVIWLREVRAERGKTFEEARGELAVEYLESERERQFSDLSGKLIDAIYRDPSTLETAANELGLTVQHVPAFARSGGPGIAADPNVLKAAFSDSVLTEGLASDLIEMTPGHAVVIRASEHVPAAVRPLEQVRPVVELAVKAQLREAKGKAELAAALAKVDSLDALKAFAEEHKLEYKEAEGVGRSGTTALPAIITAAFKLAKSADGAATIGSGDLSNGSHALIALTGVVDGDPSKVDAAQREMLTTQFGQAFGNFEAQEFIKALRKEAKIEVVESRL